MTRFWILLFSVHLFFYPFGLLYSNLSQEGRILFLIQQGEHQQALQLYQNIYQSNNDHNYELLHRIGIGLLDYGFRQQDPEVQLMTLFGAHISAHEDVYYILESGLKNRLVPIQLVALASLSNVQQDRADQAILSVLGNSHLQVRYEAMKYLCQKKHPQAFNQTESLMYKCPKVLKSIFPALFVQLGDVKSIRILRKLINDPSEDVRKAVIISAAKAGRDDFLPQIRQQLLHYHYSQQEACAYALGLLKDDHSIDKLKKLTSSQYPSVALAASWSLYQLGDESSLEIIEKLISRGDSFAVSSLGSLRANPRLLQEICRQPDLQMRVNASLALLEQNTLDIPSCMEEILIRDGRDLGFIKQETPGGSFHAWKVIPGASQLLKEDIEAYKNHLDLREYVLIKIRELSTDCFLKLAGKIFSAQQNDLIPITAELLEEINSPESIECLKNYQQKLGAPLVRNFCSLALYRLGEPGNYGEQLCEWVKKQNQTDLIQFKPFDPWKPNQNNYTLTPIETSRLLIETFETFAANQDKLGIELLIEVIANGNKKNKYALAGILLRATQ